MEKWSREETIVAFNVYCKIPFKDCRKTHPTIINYAKILVRTPSALTMKVGNIGRLDPELKEKGITGLIHGAKLEEEVWAEFSENPERLVFESEELVARFAKQRIEDSAGIKIEDLPEGKEREVVIKQRVNQAFFRSTVMSSYNFRCCISGIGNPELLEACHIIDWSQDVSNRINPKNGLCLNPFFHKAYDKHFLTIAPDLSVVVSEELLQNTIELSFREYLQNLNGQRIILPHKFLPQREFLEIHYHEFQQRRS